MKKITIEVEEDAASDMADVLCYLAGFVDCKGDDWSNAWLKSSINSLRMIKMEIQKALDKYN